MKKLFIRTLSLFVSLFLFIILPWDSGESTQRLRERYPTVVAGGGVTEDSIGTATTGTSNLNFSHTCSGTNRLLFVIVDTVSDTGAPTATYNSVAMTQAWTIQANSAYRSTGFYLVNPATGANDVDVTTDGTSNQAVAMSFNNVHQSTPVGSSNTAVGFGTTATVDITSASGELVIDGVCHVGDPITVGSGQTEKENNVYSGTAMGMSTEPGASTVTMSWDGSSQWYAIGGISLKPAS